MAELEGMELQNAHLDIHELFAYYNDLYFEGKLSACNVAWSNSRMTSLYGCLTPISSLQMTTLMCCFLLELQFRVSILGRQMEVELLSQNQLQTGVERWVLLLQHIFAAMKFSF